MGDKPTTLKWKSATKPEEESAKRPPSARGENTGRPTRSATAASWDFALPPRPATATAAPQVAVDSKLNLGKSQMLR